MTSTFRVFLKLLLALCGLGPAVLVHAATAFDACFETVSQESGVSADLLRGIARVESSGRPSAVNYSHLTKTASIDIGLMQINSRHLGALKRFGIEKEHLYEPCTSINVAAWLLVDLFRRLGTSWEAVGAYNAACSKLKGEKCRAARDTYIRKVQNAMKSLPVNHESSQPTTDSTSSSTRTLIATVVF